MPAAVGVNAGDVTGPPATGYATGADVKIAVAHVASSGPYNRNTIVAPANGFERPFTVAVSVNDPAPSVIGADAVVTIVGDAGLTTVLSFGALHPLDDDALLASPL